jgi:hypothetical protein
MDEETLNNLDSAPVNPLESIFVLPDHIASNERIAGWYMEMASQLLAEARSVPMQAAQYALMERICYTYANMRYQEFSNPDLSERQRQATQDAWQKMIDQFNRLLEKNNDKMLNQKLIEIQGILLKRLPLITDDADRANYRRQIAEDFAKIGI